MAPIFKKGKEEDSEGWAGQPHLNTGTTMACGPWNLFPNEAQEISWDQSTCSSRQGLLGQPDGFPGQDGSAGQGTAGTRVLGLSGDVSTISHRTPGGS